jgi:hypothetical protein
MEEGPHDGAVEVRKTRVVDRVVVSVAALWLLTNLAVAAVAITAGAARIAEAGRAANSSAAVNPSGLPDTDVFAPALNSGVFDLWWGVRPTPSRDGGDFLRVLDHLPPERTLGSVVGVVLERAARAGTPASELIIPKDTATLFGMPPFDITVQPDGTTVSVPWTGIDSYAETYANVVVVQRDYPPTLSDQQIAGIKRDFGLVSATHFVSIGRSPARASGTWVIYSSTALPRTYLLLPIEDSPMKGAQ